MGEILDEIRNEKDPEKRRQLQIAASRKGRKSANSIRNQANFRTVTPAGGGFITVGGENANNYFELAEQIYGDQRFAEQLAAANGGLKILRPGMKLKLPKLNTSRDPVVSGAFMEGARQLGDTLTGLGATNAFGGGRTSEDISAGLAQQFGGAFGSSVATGTASSREAESSAVPGFAGGPPASDAGIQFAPPASSEFRVDQGIFTPTTGYPNSFGAPASDTGVQFRTPDFLSAVEQSDLTSQATGINEQTGSFSDQTPAQRASSVQQGNDLSFALDELALPQHGSIWSGIRQGDQQSIDVAKNQLNTSFENALSIGALSPSMAQVAFDLGLLETSPGNATASGATLYELDNLRFLNPDEAGVSLPDDYYKTQRKRRNRRISNSFPSSNPVGYSKYSQPSSYSVASNANWRIGF